MMMNESGYRDGEFSRIGNVVSSNVQKICENASQMRKMVNQLGTTADSESFKTELHNLQHYTKTLSTDTKDKLKEMKELLAEVSPSEQKTKKLFLERLTSDFSAALNQFQNIQRTEAEREKEQVKKAHSRSFALQPPPGGRFGDGDDAVRVERSPPPGLQSQMYLEDDAALQELQDREAAVNRLEEDIRDVNDIFKDLATLVHTQGEVVDSIEASVESAQIQVEEGTQQLRKASGYQTKYRKKMVVLVTIGIVILVILILIIYFSAKN